MNALTPILSAQQETRRVNVERMAKFAERWAKFPNSEWSEYEFLDALRHCIYSDLSDEMDALRHDLRIDREGFPLNDEGDRKGNTLRYVPLKRLEAPGRRVA